MPPPPAADNGDDVDEIDGFNRFGVDLLVSGTVLFAAVISEFSPTRTLPLNEKRREKRTQRNQDHFCTSALRFEPGQSGQWRTKNELVQYLHAGFDHVKIFDPNLLAHKSGFKSFFFVRSSSLVFDC